MKEFLGKENPRVMSCRSSIGMKIKDGTSERKLEIVLSTVEYCIGSQNYTIEEFSWFRTSYQREE